MHSKSAVRVSVIVASIALIFAAAGCSTQGIFSRSASAPKYQGPTYALLVSVVGNTPPTAQQWQMLQSRFAAQLAARGAILINDHTIADYVIRVDFLPDPLDPARGTAVIAQVSANPVKGSTIASTAYAAASPYANAWAATNRYDNSAYGYDYWNSYSGYTGNVVSAPPARNTPPATTPPVVTPPTHHHPPTSVDCPPDRVYTPPPPGFAWTPPHRAQPYEGGSSYRSSGYSSSGSSSSYSSSSSSYSSDSSYSSSSSSSSSMGPVSSAPSASTSISFASPASSSSSSSSDSSSSRSTGTNTQTY